MTKIKLSIIGAGNVGSTLAMAAAQDTAITEVVLVDILKNLAQAKSYDISDALAVIGSDCAIHGTDRYEEIESSDIVVITAGIPRKPGMDRKDLIATNASIVKGAVSSVKRMAQGAVLVVVTNPLDTMTYLAYTESGFGPQRVFGMSGVLDGARMRNQIAGTLSVPRRTIEALVMGNHGTEMVPIFSHTKVGSKTADAVLSQDQKKSIATATTNRGSEIVALLGSGSAYYAPGIAAYRIVRAIARNTRETLLVSAFLNGQYGVSDICIGVPAVIGARGVESIIELKLDAEERAALIRSAQSVRETIALL